MADHSSNPPHTADQDPKTESSELLEGLDSDLLSKSTELFAALVKSGDKDKVPLVVEEMLRKAEQAKMAEDIASDRVSPSAAVNSQAVGFGVREVPVDITEEPLAPVGESSYPGREVDVPEAWLQQESVEDGVSDDAAGEEAESVEYYYDYGYDEDAGPDITNDAAYYYYGDDGQEETPAEDHPESSSVADPLVEEVAPVEISSPVVAADPADSTDSQPSLIEEATPLSDDVAAPLSAEAAPLSAEAQRSSEEALLPEEAATPEGGNEMPVVEAAESGSTGEPEAVASPKEAETSKMIWQGMPAAVLPELPTPVEPQPEVTPQIDGEQNKDEKSLIPSVEEDDASSGVGVPPAFGIFDPSDDIDAPPVDSVPGTFSAPGGGGNAKPFEPIGFKKPDFAFDESAAPEPKEPEAGTVDSADESSIPFAKEEKHSALDAGLSESEAAAADSDAEPPALDDSQSELPSSGIAPKPFVGFATKLPSPREESEAPFQPRAFSDSPTTPLGSPLSQFPPIDKAAEEAAPPVEPAVAPVDHLSPLDSPDKGNFWERPEDNAASDLPPELPVEEVPPAVDAADGSFDPVALFKGNGDPAPESVETPTFDPIAQSKSPLIEPVELPPADLPEVSVVENDVAPPVDESPALSIFEPKGASVPELEADGPPAEGNSFAPVLFPAKGREVDDEQSVPAVTPVANPFGDSSGKGAEDAAAGFMETVGPDTVEANSPNPEGSAPALELGSSESGKKGKGGLLLGTVVGVGVAAAGAYFGWHVLAKGTAGDQPSKGSQKSAEALRETGAEPVDPNIEESGATAASVDEQQVPSPAVTDPQEPSVPFTETTNDQGQDLQGQDLVAAADPDSAPKKPQTAGLANAVRDQPKPGAAPVDVPGIGNPDDAIKAFLTAETWQERYKFVHPEEVSREEMEAFYEKHGDGPYPYLAFNHSASGKVPGSDFASHLYLLRPNKEADQFVVSMEQTAEGYRIDWRAFVQFGYSMLDSFASDPNAGPMSFYVAAKRSHYFGTGIPDVENMLCLRVISPVDATKEIYAFASAGSLAAVEIKEQFRWGRTYRPVVTLEWTSAGGEKFIRIKHIDRMSWRGEG